MRALALWAHAQAAAASRSAPAYIAAPRGGVPAPADPPHPYIGRPVQDCTGKAAYGIIRMSPAPAPYRLTRICRFGTPGGISASSVQQSAAAPTVHPHRFRVIRIASESSASLPSHPHRFRVIRIASESVAPSETGLPHSVSPSFRVSLVPSLPHSVSPSSQVYLIPCPL